MDRKAAIRQYKETATPMGIYRIREIATGKSYVGTSVNLPAILNRQLFQLKSGAHRSRELQEKWNAKGADAFVIEVLDTLEPPPDSPGYDPAADLESLLALWQEKLAASGFYR